MGREHSMLEDGALLSYSPKPAMTSAALTLARLRLGTG